MIQSQNFALVQGSNTLFKSNFHLRTWPSWSFEIIRYPDFVFYPVLFILLVTAFLAVYFIFVQNKILAGEQKPPYSCQIFFCMIDFGQRFQSEW